MLAGFAIFSDLRTAASTDEGYVSAEPGKTGV